MPAPKRRLLDEAVRKHNPYSDTIAQAMDRLAAIEESLAKELPKALQKMGREKSTRRQVIRKGFQANSDSQGWAIQVPEGRVWTLKRITMVGDANGAYGLFIGSQDASGLREIIGATQAVTFNNGATGFGYSDAFSNDLFARAGDYIYLQFLGAAGAAATHTIVATLEVEMDVPVLRNLNEAINYSIQVEPEELDERDEADLITGQSATLPDIAAHFSPDTEQDMEDDTLLITHSEGAAEQELTTLLPDVSAHLPAHLRQTQ